MILVLKQAKPTYRQALAAIIRGLRQLGRRTVVAEIERALSRNDVDGVVRAVPWEALPEYFAPLRAVLADSTAYFASQTAVALGFGGRHLEGRTLEWARQQMATLVTRVTDETKQGIRTVAMRAIEEGRHPYWASRQIRAMVGLTERQAIASDNYRRRLEADGVEGQRLERMVERYDAQALRLRADNIARTEMHTAMSRGNQESYEEALRLGYLDVGTKRQWMVAEDERTCERCLAMDGQEVGILEPFEEPGEKGAEVMTPPLHPSCVLPGNVVAVPGLLAASRSFYRGPVIEVVTVGGRGLAVTENHPVLTTRGWVAAQFLNESDDVVVCTNPERIAASVYPDYQHVPAAIEQVFRALLKTSRVIATQVPVAPEDFHGDGGHVNGYVNVVRPNRLLLRDFEAMLKQPDRQISLDWQDASATLLSAFGFAAELFKTGLPTSATSMTGGREIQSFLARQPGQPQLISLAATTGGDTSLQKPATYERSANLEPLGERQFGLPSVVGTDNSLVVNTLAPHTLTNEQSILPPWYARMFEQLPHVVPGNPESLSDLDQGEPRLIEADHIISVKRLPYRGQVYDLQSVVVPVYTCNGIIVHNCRCTTGLVFSSGEQLVVEAPSDMVEAPPAAVSSQAAEPA